MRKKLFILLFLVVVLRELGYINLDYYRSSIGKNVTSNWSTNTTRINAGGRVSGNSSGNAQIVEIPVRVVYQGEVIYEDPSSGVTAVVNISSLNNGFLWVPLYKTSGFSAYANVMLEGAYDGLYWDGKWVDQLSLSGSLSLSGNIAISGICSRHTAVGLVRQAMVKDFVALTKQYFESHRFGF